MVDRDITISNLETNIRWIEDIPSHQFPGWGNVTMAMRDAMELLKEQEQRINELEEKLRLLEYGDQDILQSGMMPAT